LPKVPDEHDLQALQKIWYKKLRDSGFEDIEDVSSPQRFLKTWHSTYFFNRYTPETYEHKEMYYRMCSHFLHEYAFPTDRLKEIWKMHTEGMSLRSMSFLLKKRRIYLNKDKLNKIISNLVEVMKNQNSDNK
jgi:hypothetical protein